MSDSKDNLKFEYLHRDEGNYKIFGELIFANPNSLSAEEATEKIREKLIDGEFFYLAPASVSPFKEHKSICKTDWYEFDQLTETQEKPTQKIDFVEFIRDFNESN